MRLALLFFFPFNIPRVGADVADADPRELPRQCFAWT
jgi:hypothetical protein